MKKNKTCSGGLAPLPQRDECKAVYPSAIKAIYNEGTGLVHDDLGNLIGTGEFKDGILTVKQITQQP